LSASSSKQAFSNLAVTDAPLAMARSSSSAMSARRELGLPTGFLF
jgi:hypothetical protein